MIPSRHSQIRGIQKKRYNEKIFAPYTGSSWFFMTVIQIRADKRHGTGDLFSTRGGTLE
jgi:hypothetical protein